MNKYSFRFPIIIFFSLLLFSNNMVIGKSRVLLIPLDDRPPCLQFVQKIGLIGEIDIISPPISMLGKFTLAGNTQAIGIWLLQQDLSHVDALIVSLDMIAYGGLVASRVGQTSVNQALERFKVIEKVKARFPKLPIYAQSVVMRLAPTADGNNEAFREKIARWAEISPSMTPTDQQESKQLELEIPKELLEKYRETRNRNARVNEQAIRMVKKKIIHFLILSQDDARPKGMHVQEKVRLKQMISNPTLRKKVLLMGGTDEVGMLLMTRHIVTKSKTIPKVFVVYSSIKSSGSTMPFEDQSLRKTILGQFKSIGVEEICDSNQANLWFYVFTSRNDKAKTQSFVHNIENQVKKGKSVMVADIDASGSIQGGDSLFAVELLRKGLFSKIVSYASWNTAGNTIGTTLSQGMVYAQSASKTMSDTALQTQAWFMYHRLLDDCYFHTLIRPKLKAFCEREKITLGKANFQGQERVIALGTYLLQKFADALPNIQVDNKYRTVNCLKTEKLRFNLPWDRLFEADIDFEIGCGNKP